MNEKGRVAVLLALMAVPVVGCAVESTHPTEVEPSSAPLFTGNTNAFWSGSPTFIPVCWDNAATPDHATNADAKTAIRLAVESQWSRAARVNFTGWGDCASAPAGRRIEVRLDPTTTAGQCPATSDPKATDKCFIGTGCLVAGGASNCMDWVVLHEFGHAIGFYHEEERPDYDDAAYWNVAGGGTIPAGCQKQTWCGVHDTCPAKVKFGGYDRNSVMSYCTTPTKLSPDDIVSVQHVYGYRRPGSITSPGGNCLAVNFNNDGSTFTWDCDEAAGQKWTWSPSTKQIVSDADPSKCLGQPTPLPNGARLHAVDCAVVRSKWDFENVEVRGFGGKCLDLHNGDTTNGNRVQMWECNGSANQKWSINGLSQIKFGGLTSTKCVTASGGSTADGSGLVIWDCGKSAVQAFAFSGNNLRVGDQCVDVPYMRDADYAPNGAVGTAANPNTIPNGIQLQMFRCTSNQYNQKFHLSGPVRLSGSNKCIDLHNGSLENSGFVQLWDCLGNANQVWDTYF